MTLSDLSSYRYIIMAGPQISVAGEAPAAAALSSPFESSPKLASNMHLLVALITALWRIRTPKRAMCNFVAGRHGALGRGAMCFCHLLALSWSLIDEVAEKGLHW